MLSSAEGCEISTWIRSLLYGKNRLDGGDGYDEETAKRGDLHYIRQLWRDMEPRFLATDWGSIGEPQFHAQRRVPRCGTTRR